MFSSAFVLCSISFNLVQAKENSLVYYKLVAQFHNALKTNCPQSALCTLEKLKKDFSGKKENEVLEAKFLDVFNPVKYFTKIKQNESSFFTARVFAESNRDYEIVSSLLKDEPGFFQSSFNGDIDNYVRRIESWKKELPKYMFINKNMKKQIYFVFPSINNESISPNGMHKVVWRESTSGQNRLYFISKTGTEYLVDDWLYKAEVIWSNNSSYVALELNYGSNISRIWLIDVNDPANIIKIEGLPQIQEMEKKHKGLNYDLRSWISNSELCMFADNYLFNKQSPFYKKMVLRRKGDGWVFRRDGAAPQNKSKRGHPVGSKKSSKAPVKTGQE